MRVLEGHIGKVTSLAVLSDGRVVSGGYDKKVRVWDLSTGKCVRILEGHSDCIRCLVVLSDGRVVSGSADNTFRVWDLLTGEFVVTNVRLLDDVVFPLSILPALKSFGLSHVSASCVTKSSGLGGGGLAVGMESGKMYFFTLLVSMYKFQNS